MTWGKRQGNRDLGRERSGLPKLVRRLLYLSAGGQESMLRIVFGVAAFAALLVTYWVHPTAAWIVLGSTFTLAVAFKVRQREEAEGALQATVVDE
jgi:hypothetical protein